MVNKGELNAIAVKPPKIYHFETETQEYYDKRLNVWYSYGSQNCFATLEFTDEQNWKKVKKVQKGDEIFFEYELYMGYRNFALLRVTRINHIIPYKKTERYLKKMKKT